MEVIHTPQGGDKPVFLLDVEGVFLTLDEDNPGDQPSEGYVRFEATAHDFYRPDHGDLLRGILPEVDACWFTGVMPETVKQLEPALSLPSLPFVDFFAVRAQPGAVPRYRRPQDDLLHYKRDAADYMFAGRKLAWIDDWFDAYDFEWAKARQAGGAETLLLKTEYKKGLRPEHIEQVRAWVGGVALDERPV
jgi:hypothetical protein